MLCAMVQVHLLAVHTEEVLIGR